MHLTDDMTTASQSPNQSCIKTSEHPLPCSSVTHNHSYSLRASGRHCMLLPGGDLQLLTATRATEKLSPPLPLTGHARRLQPQARSRASCPGACATSCKNISAAAQDPKQVCRASAERQCHRPQDPAHSPRQPPSCIAWICSGCLISTSQITDIYLRLESLK